jgi:hypothetical protein
MKVDIRPYRKWFGPYQLAEKLLFWKDKEDAVVFAFGEWLDKYTPIARISSLWFFSKRKVKVRIDPYDTWSMDDTLAIIILPMLKQLRDTKHGSPSVSDADVPEELRFAAAENPGHEFETDSNWHKRWEWVLNEMIWAFEQIVDEDSDSIYFNDGILDVEKWKAYNARIDNGTRLFGVYYRGLWD